MTLDELLRNFEPRLQDAFSQSINELRSQVVLRQVVEALERGSVDDAIDALSIERSAFSRFEDVLEQAFREGGTVAVDELGQIRDAGGQAFVFRFDSRNLEAEAFIRNHSSNLITNIVDEQREVSRIVLQRGLSLGNNPRTTALDLIGRVDRASGQRVGGLIGLNLLQEQAVQRAQQELVDGDFTSFLQRSARDRRFDPTLVRLRRDGGQLTNTQIQQLISRYRDGLLLVRGQTVARTETLSSIHAAQDQALRQLVATGRVAASAVRRVWDATGDARTRLDHLIADGQSIGLDETFTVGGAQLRFPGDPNGPADQIINCRCILRVRIDHLANVN